MKKIFITCTVLCLLLISNIKAENNNLEYNDNLAVLVPPMGDWRQGVFHRNVSEHLFIANIEAIPVITDAFKNTTKFAMGLTLGYEYKIRPSTIHSRINFGFGGHIGINRYFGSKLNMTVVGNNNAQTWDRHKSYSEVPLLVDFNLYYNFNKSNILIGISAGGSFMLGERDAKVDQIGLSLREDLEQAHKTAYGKEVDIISIQNSNNNMGINHILPTFRGYLGYMWEISSDMRFRLTAGIEYQGKYDDEYRGFYVDNTYYEYYHKQTSKQMLNPFVSVGFVYSL